ncbi:MAG: maleylpyruvate isomerase family mycothiol-dependent enzyme [Acidimicrobiia bacterium]|nr:maleylpyruvate isomerase family mycothiol-dependent enzyme [Acidimicrobiia bacterium]
MEHAGLIDALRREGEAFAGVTPVDIDVPTCPGWTLIDLHRHVGSVLRFQLAQVATDDPDLFQRAPEEPEPDLEDLADWVLDGVDAVADRLAAIGPDHPTSSWFGPRPAVFWARRAAHEIAMHRWDAEASITSPRPLDRAQAGDIIDELFEVIVPRRLERHPWSDPAATVHLHATDEVDGEGEWMIRVEGPTIDVAHAHGKGDIAARGSASDLALMIFGRIPLARLEVFGDATVIDRWHTSIRI